jgi:hypothetical protein
VGYYPVCSCPTPTESARKVPKGATRGGSGDPEPPTFRRAPRRDEIIIHRLRIGHSFLTHGHLLRGETCPRCSACDVDLTVKHILLHCVSFAIAHDHSFNMAVTTQSELFSKVSSRSIIEFIKKTGRYRKI